MKKLEGGLWLIRFILPEHHKRILSEQKEQERRGKPEVDEQEWELIMRALAESQELGTEITVNTFDPFEDRSYTGVVLSINQHAKQIKLQLTDGELEWIWIAEITSVST
ncbi:YolD-like protein [compost metagenome]